MPYFHLNARRAKILKQQLRTADSTERTARRYACARELLYAGSTKEKPGFEQLALFYLRLGERQNCPEDRLAAVVGDEHTRGSREPTMLRSIARSR